jgi:hypothetical protein
MRRLVLPGFLALGIVTALTLGLVTAPPVTAAQKVGATLYDAHTGDLSLRSFSERDGGFGLEIGFMGSDSERQSVRVYLPVDFKKLSRLPVRFDDAPPGTKYHECLPPLAQVPRDARQISHQACTVFGPESLVTMLVQTFPKRVPDFGGQFTNVVKDIYVSILPSGASVDFPTVYPNPTTFVDTTDAPFTVPGLTSPITMWDDAALLQAYPRWSKFYSGTRARSATNHFPLIFGSLTFAGIGVYGPGNRYGSPTNEFGRNVYIDTFDSDYGLGWRRVMGVLTQPPNGTFCYEFSKKGGSDGKTGVSTENFYRMTVIGPSLTPVLRKAIKGPTFAYGGPNYNPLKEMWGTNFSTEQASALRQQALTMGPEWRRKVKGTDCAQTLRQLPESFFTQAG